MFSGQCLLTFEGHTGIRVLGGLEPRRPLRPIGWGALDGYAGAMEDKTLRLWEISSGKCLRTFEGHTRDAAFGVVESRRPLRPIGWGDLAGYAAAMGRQNAVAVEVSSGQCLRTFEGHTSGVWSVSWSPDGRFALSGSDDKTLRLWEVSSGECLRTFEGHTGAACNSGWSWSPDGRFALSGEQ